MEVWEICSCLCETRLVKQMSVDFMTEIKPSGNPIFVSYLDDKFASGIKYALFTKSTAIACIVRGDGILQNAGPVKVMLAAEFNVIDKVRGLPVVAARDEKRFVTEGAVFVACSGGISWQ